MCDGVGNLEAVQILILVKAHLRHKLCYEPAQTSSPHKYILRKEYMTWNSFRLMMWAIVLDTALL